MQAPLENGRTPLMQLVASPGPGPDPGVLESLLSSADARDGHGKTALVLALESGRRAAALRLARVTDVSLCDAFGRTALHVAASAGEVEVAKTLLERGVAGEARTARGETALHSAARAGHADMVSVLLAAGCDARARDGAGELAMEVASSEEARGVLARATAGLREEKKEESGVAHLGQGAAAVAPVVHIGTAPPVKKKQLKIALKNAPPK